MNEPLLIATNSDEYLGLWFCIDAGYYQDQCGRRWSREAIIQEYPEYVEYPEDELANVIMHDSWL